MWCLLLKVRTFNVDKTKNMRMLNPEDIDQLITISGMVIRLSPLVPEMREGGTLIHTLLFMLLCTNTSIS